MSNLNVMCIVVCQLPKIVYLLHSALQKLKYLRSQFIPEICMHYVEIMWTQPPIGIVLKNVLLC